MTMDDIVSYLKELSDTNKIYIGIIKYPITVSNNILISVIDKNFGVGGNFISNLNISSPIQEKDFIIFKKLCLQYIEYIKRRTDQFKKYL